MDSKKLYWLLLATFAILTGLIFRYRGVEAWKFWNIPTLEPSFADTRIITASSESFALGKSPELENPRDPFGRPFNLPALWKLLFYTRMTQADTTLLASLFIFSFFLGLLLLPAQFSIAGAVFLAVLSFSPPVLLAVERGNVDLFVFFLCSLVLLILPSKSHLSFVFLELAVFLKIYPFFGLIALLGDEPKRFFKQAALILFLFLPYVVLTFNSFRLIFSGTEKGYDYSYGAGVLPLYIGWITHSLAWRQVATLVAYILFLAILIICVFCVESQGNRSIMLQSSSLPAFRLGAGIYLGTFFLGNNWDYRLIFLLFTIPTLTEWWTRSRITRFILCAVVICFSYLWIKPFLPGVYFIVQLLEWLLFAGLLYMVLLSLPGWLRIQLEMFVDRYARTSNNPVG